MRRTFLSGSLNKCHDIAFEDIIDVHIKLKQTHELFPFECVLKNNSVYTFAFETEQERQEWTRIIETYCSISNSRNQISNNSNVFTKSSLDDNINSNNTMNNNNIYNNNNNIIGMTRLDN